MVLFKIATDRAGGSTMYVNDSSRQEGVALLMVLFLCIIIGVLGVTVVSSSITQTQMAVSVLDQDIAFQSAETALRSGEQWIAGFPANSLPLVPVANCAQPCVEVPGGLPANPWPGAANVAGVAGQPGVQGANAAPQYVIEYLANHEVWTTQPGESLVESTNREPSTTNFYKVTARGTGRTAQAQAVVQSIYAW